MFPELAKKIKEQERHSFQSSLQGEGKKEANKIESSKQTHLHAIALQVLFQALEVDEYRCYHHHHLKDEDHLKHPVI